MATAAGGAPLFVIIFILGLLAAPSAAEYDYVLYSDPPQSLLPGQNLTYNSSSPHSSPHVLSFQSGCNVVLYNSGEAAWSTNTSHGNGQDCYLTLLPNGELVLRRNFHYPIWRSGARSSAGGYAFILDVDGGLGVYGPELWSNTDEVTLSDQDPMVSTTDYVFYSHQVSTLSDNPILRYKNFRLVLSDCNLVLKDTAATGRVMWQTNTQRLGATCFAYLDSRGEFFIKYSSEGVVWRSGKRSAAASVPPKAHALVLRYDGRLVIYHEQIWSIQAPAPALGLAS